MADVESILALCRQNGRVCPMPDRWNDMFKLLKVDGIDPFDREDLLVPLILAAWHYSSDDSKAGRLEEHVRWADQHAILDRIAPYLSGLEEEQWYHRGD